MLQTSMFARKRLFVAMLVGCGALALQSASPIIAQTESASTAGQFQNLSVFALNDPASAKVVDHQPLGSFIETFAVAEGGRRAVNYSAARGRGADYLSSYAQFLSTLNPSTLRSDEQLAYWLNLRNALVLLAFSEKGGGNLKKLRGVYDAPGEGWTKKRVTIAGTELSIDDIERGIILRNWDNPIVLYGLYQASPSGPQLFERAFSGASVWSDLNAVGVKFANAGSAVRVRDNVLQLSSIYSWVRRPCLAMTTHRFGRTSRVSPPSDCKRELRRRQLWTIRPLAIALRNTSPVPLAVKSRQRAAVAVVFPLDLDGPAGRSPFCCPAAAVERPREIKWRLDSVPLVPDRAAVRDSSHLSAICL